MNNGVKNLGNGLWFLRVQPVNPATGKRVSRERTVEASNEKEALRLKNAFEQEVCDKLKGGKGTLFFGKGKISNSETLKDYAEFWLTHPSGTNRGHVAKKNRDVFQNAIWPIIGSVKMSDLQTSHILFWQQEIQKTKSTKGEIYSRQSQLRAWRVLRSCINQAGIESRCDKGICQGIRFSPRTGALPKQRASLTPDEVTLLLKAADAQSTDVRAMIYLQLTIGCRIGELTALTWEDIDFDSLNVSINKSQFGGEINLPKSGTVRNCPLMPAVADLLRHHKDIQQKTNWPNKHNLVFPSQTGTHRYPAMMFKVLHRCCEAVGIKKRFGSHSLRRTFVDTVRAHTEKQVVKSIVGHATDAMYQLYSTVRQDERRNAQDKAFTDLLPENRKTNIVKNNNNEKELVH